MNSEKALERINYFLKNNPVMIFSNSCCLKSKMIKEEFDNLNIDYYSYDLDSDENGEDIKKVLANKIKNSSLPQIFVGGDLVGNYEETLKAKEDGILEEILKSLNL
ncbi:hypothetical protein RND71_043289 [Anisodus tanguticus]|uniref:Glutaredoxin domain-containing protein n=1 Tax=Anisodus tanguticus TaxID=243964 RepID=A0AAE1QP58_9SOLA|nr:hypothetical protein RND71_043289 [Anisodus tanguticus]